jgi:hypothetical protein
MNERKQDAMTRKFLFSIMEDMVEEETNHLRGKTTEVQKDKTAMGHMDASLSVLMGVTRDSSAVPTRPTSTTGWAKSVLERVDALPPEAKPLGVRRVKRRKVCAPPGRSSDASAISPHSNAPSDFSAIPHGHVEKAAQPARRVRKARVKATRAKMNARR